MKVPTEKQIETERPPSKVKIFKIILNLFIVFHLFVIVVAPIGSSHIMRAIPWMYTYYTNLLNLSSSWNFFSPDPAHTMFIKNTIYYEDELGKELKPFETEIFPTEADQGTLNSYRRRFLYSMRYMILDSQRLEEFLAPFICKTHVGASRVFVEFSLIPILPLEVWKLKGKNEETQNLIRKDFDCNVLKQKRELNQ